MLTLVLCVAGASANAAQFVRVVDGDTLEVEGTRYRLHGIDAPEAGQQCKRPDGGSWQCGQAALKKIQALVSGREVTCAFREKDVYGRSIATCKAGTIDLNLEMVRSGLAWAFRKYSQDYVGVEEEARLKKAGVWQANTQTPWDYRAGKWDASISTATNDNCPIKGNINSKQEKIYHAPWSKDYERTKIDSRKGERWFCTEGEAVAAGWRAPQWGK